MSQLNFASVVAPFGVESGRRIAAEELVVLNIKTRDFVAGGIRAVPSEAEELPHFALGNVSTAELDLFMDLHLLPLVGSSQILALGPNS